MLINWVRERSINSVGYYFSSALEHYLPPITYFSSSEKHPLLLNQGVNVFSIEDSPSSHFARGLSGCFPGLALVHHYYLTTRIYEALHNSPWKKNMEFCVDQKITWTPRDTKYEEARHEALREASISALTVFTSPRDRECFENKDGATVIKNCAYIPFPVSDRHLKQVNRRSRKIAVISGVNLEWHPHSWLMALPHDTPVAWYVMEKDLERAHEISNRFAREISICECKSPDTWREALEEGPLVIHPLYSGYHTLSPYLEMSLAAGVRILTNDFGYPRYLPDTLLYRVPMGRQEVSFYRSLFSYLLDEQESESVSDQRFKYAYQVHRAEKVAQEFLSALEHMIKNSEKILRPWQDLYASARNEILRDVIKDPVLIPALQELMPSTFNIAKEMT